MLEKMQEKEDGAAAPHEDAQIARCEGSHGPFRPHHVRDQWTREHDRKDREYHCDDPHKKGRLPHCR